MRMNLAHCQNWAKDPEGPHKPQVIANYVGWFNFFEP